MPVAGSGGGTLPPFDAGTDANRNMVGPGALCARLAAIQCAAEVHCCTNPKHTRETCQTQSTMLCSANLYLDQIAMNAASGFDPAATASAFSKFEEKARQCDITVAAWAGSADGLLGMFKGTLPPGANCTPANRADLPMAAAALASCTGNSTSACLANGVLGDWTCAPKNAAGGSCHTDLNCATGNYCANVGKTGFGKCAPLLALEAPCTEGNQCSSLSCSDGKCVPPGQQVAYCVVLP
jgi:hypothetical protein